MSLRWQGNSWALVLASAVQRGMIDAQGSEAAVGGAIVSRMAILSLLCVAFFVRVAPSADRVDYLRDVKPILKERCFACHGALKQSARLRLDTGAALRKGGKSGPAVDAARPAQSLILNRVSDEDSPMPPEGPRLTPAQVAILRAWIEQGAVSPTDEEPDRPPQDHWAFRTPVRPAVPRVKDASWPLNPIDSFLAAGHEKRGLTPAEPAVRNVLLRRVYLDLIGLPPTREELLAFLKDDSSDAYEKVVDKLLASPQYGERWARHWMDVWRYSDWYGRRQVPDVWNSAPQIWRWRDWIVRSLNDDHGYDRLVREMLAADEVAPDDAEAVVATGYLVRNWYALNPNQWMRDTVEHTGKAFLGLTLNCAHCHDHKYDPISQEDYFRFRAFFETIGLRQDRVVGEADPGPFQEYNYSQLRKIVRVGAIRVYDRNLDAPTWFYSGGDERNRVKEKGSIAPGVPRSLGGPAVKVEPIALPASAYSPALRPALVEAERKQRLAAITQAEAELARTPPTQDATKAVDELAQAEAAYQKALTEAGPPAALAGKQSLLLDAATGRRSLLNPLTGLKSLPDGSVVSFRIQLTRDVHVNFQLARDLGQGLTASFVGWEKGRILAYKPGGFTEFEVGRYDLAGGQKRFETRLTLETKTDRCLLTVRCLDDGKTLVESVPVARNGWNPVADRKQGFFIDARPGSVAAFDDITITAKKDRLLSFDFEAPRYPEGKDVLGIDGWASYSSSLPPAFSVVSTLNNSPKLAEARKRLQTARTRREDVGLERRAAEARLGAAKAEQSSFEARLAAAKTPAVELAKAAHRAEREALTLSAEAQMLTARQAVARAEARPATDPERANALKAAAALTTAAQTARTKAALPDTSGGIGYTPLGPVFPKTSSGRRKALAGWITSPDNPLTARVAVNHIWMRHFHAPLVESVFDLGRNGAKPSHPELLDWLAVELMDKGWSMKHLHRLIVTSRTYRLASAPGKESASHRLDPENVGLWRMNLGRMEAEVVRDSLLHCAGELDLTRGGQELENSEALTTKRRSLYYSCHPEAGGQSPLGVLFDAADAGECYRRTRSVLPQQALALTNSDFVHARSVAVAKRLGTGERDRPGGFVTAAFEMVLGRSPSAEELDLCQAFLKKQVELARRQGAADAEGRARAGLVRVLFNHTDFLTIR